MDLDILKEELDNSITDKYRLVFVMVQIRKVLERLNLKDVYPTIYFYCNWLLHSKINDFSRIKNVLDKITNEIKNFETPAILIDFLHLQLLKQEIEKFLKELNLPKKIIQKGNSEKFFSLLYGILKDSPLEINYNSIKNLSLVNFKFESENSEVNCLIEFFNGKKIEFGGNFEEIK